MDKDLIKIILGIIVFLAILSFGIWISVFKYNDCLKVGHNGIYCILNFGN